LNSYKIYNANLILKRFRLSHQEKFNDLTASWIEVVAGLKAKVFDNVFIGFSLRLNRLVSNKSQKKFYLFPGFNRTYDGDFGVGLNYTVSYFIPILRRK
jgi:hypothetical protein